nr:hypothetical protein [Tanacetum cinerariifolium]
ARNRLDRLGLAVDEEAGDAMVDQLGHRAAIDRDHRRAAGHCLDHRQAEGFVEADEVEQRRRRAERPHPLGAADRAGMG